MGSSESSATRTPAREEDASVGADSIVGLVFAETLVRVVARERVVVLVRVVMLVLAVALVLATEDSGVTIG